MAFWSVIRGSICKETALLQQAVGQLPAGSDVVVALFPDHLVLAAPLGKQPLSLDYRQIQAVQYDTQTQQISKEKSPLGRAAVGGMLLGRTGAVVGAISGVGTKTIKRKQTLLTIIYTPSTGGSARLELAEKSGLPLRHLAKKLTQLSAPPAEKSAPMGKL